MCLTCILFYLLSALFGLFLGRIIFGKSKSEQDLISSASANKRALEDLTIQMQDFKNTTHEKLLLKDAQITKLSQGSEQSVAQDSGNEREALLAQLKDQKFAIANLEAELEREHESTKEAISRWEEFRERMHRVKSEYADSQKLIKKLRKENRKLNAQATTGSSDSTTSESLNDANAKVKSLKSQLKHSKKHLAKAREDNDLLQKTLKQTKKELLSNVEITESVNMKKLINLLKKGKLSSINKKVSRKKSN